MDKKIRNILLFCGYRGQRNIGDEAMAVNIVERIQIAFPETKISVMINDNELDPLKLYNVSYIHTFFQKEDKFRKFLSSLPLSFLWDKIYHFIKICLVICFAFIDKIFSISFFVFDFQIKKIIDFVKECDVIWIGGGGVINDYAAVTGIYSSFCLANLGKVFNKTVVITGQGIGPLRNKFNKALVKNMMYNCQYVGVRDTPFSKNILKNIGIQENKIFEAGDDAYSLKCEDKKCAKEILDKEGIDISKQIIGLSFRHEKEIKFISQLIDQITDENKSVIVMFIPSYYGKNRDDRDRYKKCMSLIKNSQRVHGIFNEYTTKEIKSIVGFSNVFVGFSYHPLIFALSQNIPTVSFYSTEYYMQKNMGLFKLLKLEQYSLSMKNENLSIGKDMIISLLHKSKEYENHIIKENERFLRMNDNFYEEILTYIDK